MFCGMAFYPVYVMYMIFSGLVFVICCYWEGLVVNVGKICLPSGNFLRVAVFLIIIYQSFTVGVYDKVSVDTNLNTNFGVMVFLWI